MYCRTFTTTRASPMVSLKPPEEPQIDIVDVGGRAHRRVHQARVSIHANVSLHAEVVSRPGEPPPEPLAEPYVTLSRHTAPVIQPAA